ncbi:hypothetical protein JOB18_000555 [Solea senegalensis]|uniref:Uncharacterized protein n=1 Tax=Solea senegalensis TaxID=28829 RepID=A0AAV6Q291_SOLSE|nr:hypothetical protein JOB18_000555 [Solea senegalensis]
MVGTDGGTIKSSRPLLKPSVLDLCGQSICDPSKRSITFVKAGEQATPARRSPADILTSAKDRQLLVDLQQQLKFPSHVAVTTHGTADC